MVYKLNEMTRTLLSSAMTYGKPGPFPPNTPFVFNSLSDIRHTLQVADAIRILDRTYNNIESHHLAEALQYTTGGVRIDDLSQTFLAAEALPVVIGDCRYNGPLIQRILRIWTEWESQYNPVFGYRRK